VHPAGVLTHLLPDAVSLQPSDSHTEHSHANVLTHADEYMEWQKQLV